jgi:polyhydroxyalkanoate synthesis regulator phasin
MSEIYEALRRAQQQRQQHDGHGAGDNGGATDTMLEELLHRAEAIFRFSEDVQHRLSEIGVDGLGGVLRLHGQLRSATDTVARSEIETSTADVTRLVATLQNLRDELQRMKALKRTFEGVH